MVSEVKCLGEESQMAVTLRSFASPALLAAGKLRRATRHDNLGRGGPFACCGIGASGIGPEKNQKPRVKIVTRGTRLALASLRAYNSGMTVVLQHRREERLLREKQLSSGARCFTHIRPAPKHPAKIGALVHLQNAYGKNARFGPPCVVLSSRNIKDISELSQEERKYLAISVEEMRARDWARAPKLEVIIAGVLSEGP